MKTPINKVYYTEDGQERLFVRNDIPMFYLHQTMPASRWDADYWNPKFEDKFIRKFGHTLGEYISFTTYGQVGHREYCKKGIIHLSPANLPVVNGLITGIDYEVRKKYVIKDGHNDPVRSRLKYGDLLLSNSGVAATGRPAIFLDKGLYVNISQHINLLKLTKDINKFFVVVYLQSYFAQLQIERFIISVGPSGLTFDEIKLIKLPLLSKTIQSHIEKEFLKINSLHKKSMEAKKRKDEQSYEKNILKASAQLKELVAKTEDVIRGKRKDII